MKRSCTISCVVAAALFSMSAEKKYIGHGWDLLAVSPQEVLANADAFDQTALDGVTLCLNHVPAKGPAYHATSVLTDPAWTKEAFSNEVDTFHAITRHPSLKHSFLSCFWAPGKRLDWTDDAAWAKAANNMAVMAWIAKRGGLAGIIADPEDYPETRQYKLLPADPGFPATASLARKRGAQLMKAMTKEYPEITVLSFWLLSMSVSGSYSVSTDMETEMAQKGDLWPAFINGLLDGLTPATRLVDGDEGGYNYEAEKRDFYVAAWRQKEGALPLIAEENRTKFMMQLLAGSGHYLDKYTNKPDSPWYFGPVNGSRLAHLSLNIHQAMQVAGEYIWLYGEKYPWIHWKNTRSKRFENIPTWEENLPGLTETLNAIKTPMEALRKHLEEKRAQGTLTNLAANSACTLRPAPSSGNFHAGKVPSPYGCWQNEKKRQGVFGTDTATGHGDKTSLCMKGVENGCFTYDFRGVHPGQCFAVEVYVKGARELSSISWQKNNKWDWSIPSVSLYFDDRAKDGWRHASTIVRIPDGADALVLLLNARLGAGETAWFDDIAIYPL